MSTVETATGKIPCDSFGNRIYLIRAETGLSAESLGAICGVSHSTVHNWERGVRPHGMDRVVNAICDATGYSRFWLMFGGSLSPIDDRESQSGCTDYEGWVPMSEPLTLFALSA